MLIKKVNLAKGSITFKVLLAVIIVGSITLVSGIFPTSQITPQDSNAPIVKPVLDQDNINKDSLQLRTIGFEQCSQKSAVSLVVDYSGSMAPDFGPRKLPATKDALKTFGSHLTDDSVVALHTFNMTNEEIIEFSEYGTVKSNFNSRIDSLNRPEGWTYTRSALEYVKGKISTAMEKWPTHQFTLVLLSDGIPERENTPTKLSCPHPQNWWASRNFSIAEDPTEPPNIATEIQDMGVRIFSIAILDEADQCFSSALQELMQDVASPNSYYATYNPDDLSGIYSQIVFETCKAAQ